MNAPELPATVAARAFIRGTALLSLIMAGLSVAWSLFQILVVCVFKPADFLSVVPFMLPPGMSLPALLVWLAQHALSLSVGLLGLSLAFALVSLGLFNYRRWGYIGFIVFLIVIAVANFALLPMFDHLIINSITSLFPSDFLSSNEGREAALYIRNMRGFMWGGLGSTMLLIAALHGWLIFKLCRPPVRALFY